MIKRYLVTGYWTDKKTGKPVSTVAEITEDINKDGKPYAITNTESRETVDGTYPVGTILTTGALTLTVESGTSKAQAANVKLGGNA